MQSVREWATALCCTCIIGAMLSMVSPSGSSKRLMGMILTLMTLCVLFRPVSAVKDFALNLKNYTFDEAEYRNTELEDEVERSAKDVYSSYMEENLRRVLDGEGISYKSVLVTMDNSADGCISIGQVEVIVKNEDDQNVDRIKELLRGYIGFEPAVNVR